MPYIIPNKSSFIVVQFSDFFSLSEVRKLIRQLRTVDFYEAESRRVGHSFLLKFLDTALAGHEIFNANTRFPDNRYYISTYDSAIENAISGLQFSPTWRPISKCEYESCNCNDGNGNNRLAFNNAKQQFEESLYNMYVTAKSSSNIWYREAVEGQLNIEWREY
jgi:hypothetical protein